MRFGIIILLLLIIVSCGEKFDDTSTLRYADKIRTIYDKYLNDNKIYYTVVPSRDFEMHNKMVKTLNNVIDFAVYIDINNILSPDDYYKDDIHWKQENLHRVIDKIGAKMNFTINFGEFKENIHESIVYLTNNHTESATVDNMQYPEITTVYDLSKIGYDIFLSGVSPLRTITNPMNESGRKLVIFGDSFVHNFAPLLIEEYSYIIIIDSRFIMTDLLGDYVDFSNADILFMHSDLIINNSLLLK